MRYRIDADDALVDLHPDRGLDRYVEAAAVPHLPEHWLGEVIWACIADDEVRAVLTALVAAHVAATPSG